MTTSIRNRPPSWHQRAACRDAEPTQFDDVDLVKWAPPEAATAAHDFCSTCTVRAACDAFANREGAVGVWGGKYRHAGDNGCSTTITVTDLLHPDMAPRFDRPAELAGRRRQVWDAMPPGGFVSPGYIADAVGLDQRDVSFHLRWMAARGFAASPVRGVWRRSTPDSSGVEQDERVAS